jgi:hypothetical protein
MASGSYFLGLYYYFWRGQRSREGEGSVFIYFLILGFCSGRGFDVLVLLRGTFVVNLPLLSLLFCPFLM